MQDTPEGRLAQIERNLAPPSRAKANAERKPLKALELARPGAA